MLAKLSLATGLVVMAAAFSPTGASAASMPQSRLPGLTTSEGSLVQQAQWGRCRFWHRECAARWGWRTPGYFRCLYRHGC
jgi:hypothetical protein